MFIKPETLKLSKEEINRINEKLFAEEQKNSHKRCHDCGVKPGHVHLEGCDVSRCDKHHGQTLLCGCKPKDIWDGLWPGTKWCYNNKEICYDTCSKQWMFDYNIQAVKGR